MLTKEQILERFNTDAEFFLKEYSVSKLGLFGSFARGEAKADSDIDVLVNLDEPTLRHYMGLKFYLGKIFHRDVDLVMEGSLKPRVKPYVEKEAVYAEIL